MNALERMPIAKVCQLLRQFALAAQIRSTNQQRATAMFSNLSRVGGIVRIDNDLNRI
jgi:hypothetical protein